MKPAAAFATGLWIGALAMAGVAAVYVRVWSGPVGGTTPQAGAPLEARLQLLQQEQARAAAESVRLRQTVAELRASLEMFSSAAAAQATNSAEAAGRSPRPLRGVVAIESWIIDSVLAADAQGLPRLEEAAGQNHSHALDALALLARLDNAAALTRVWGLPSLHATNQLRATQLVAATVEVNPRAEEWILSLTGAPGVDPVILEAAVAGLNAPDFPTRLARGTGIRPPPHFDPDYNFRLKLLENFKPTVGDNLHAMVEQARASLTRRAAAGEVPRR